MSKHHGFQDLIDDSSAAPVASIGTENGLQDALYVKEPGSADPVSMGDINQGTQLGDCFLLSGLGEIARQSVIQDNLNFIPSMIHPQANGTENVTLYQQLPTGRMSAVTENVTNVFAPGSVNSDLSGSNQAAFGGQQEIWPQVIEKAVGQLMGGYPNSIAGGGYTASAMETLTGQAATVYGTASATLANMMAWTNNNDLISFDTGQGNAGLGMVADHSYAFAGYVGSGANEKIQLQNPWGFDQPPALALSSIVSGASGIVQIDVGHFNAGAGHGTSLI